MTKRGHDMISESIPILTQCDLSGIFIFNTCVTTLNDIAKGNKNAEVLLRINESGILIGYMDCSLTFGTLSTMKFDKSLNEKAYEQANHTIGLRLADLKDMVSMINSRDSFKAEGIRLTMYDDRLLIDVISGTTIIFTATIKAIENVCEQTTNTFSFEQRENVIDDDDNPVTFDICDRISASDCISKEKDSVLKIDILYRKVGSLVEKKSVRLQSHVTMGLAFDTRMIGDDGCTTGYTQYCSGEKWGNLVKTFRSGTVTFCEKYIVFESSSDNGSFLLLMTYTIAPNS